MITILLKEVRQLQTRIIALAAIGILLIISGGFVSYYGTERGVGTTVHYSYLFGSVLYVDYSTNKTYQDGGGPDIDFIPPGDVIEILPVQIPKDFNGSIKNFYYVVWDGGEKANLPGNQPTTMIPISELPQIYRPINSEVAFELVANPFNTIYFDGIVTSWQPSNVSIPTGLWKGTFFEFHTVSANFILFFLGVMIMLFGITAILLAIRIPFKKARGTTTSGLTNASSIPPPPPPSSNCLKLLIVKLILPSVPRDVERV